MTDYDTRLQVDPAGTLWLDITDRPDHASGGGFALKSGTDPDDPVREVNLTARDLAEIRRLISVSGVGEGHREAKHE